MYWFGKNINNEYWLSEKAWPEVIELKNELQELSIEKIIDCLDRFGSFWEKNNCFYEEIKESLKNESGFSDEDVESTLKILPSLLKKENLEKRITAEFINPKVLDEFVKLPRSMALTHAKSLGIILHVTAGNVFLSSIDSLVMGLVTKNISLLKVSGENKFFPNFFAQMFLEFDSQKILSNKFAVLYWPGGQETTENFLKSKVDAIMAWGGEEMISSYKRNLPLNVKLLDFGPKISIQVISKNGLENKSLNRVATKLVDDIIAWDQGACASPQNVYIEEGIDSDKFLSAIDEAFQKARPAGKLDADEAVEILKEKYRGLYSELMEDGSLKTGSNYLVHQEKNKYLRPSPLHRSIIIKKYKDLEDLVMHLGPFAYYLQSCSYLLSQTEKDKYLIKLSNCGIKRFAPLGTITFGMEGAPHDGRFVLRELVHFVGDELRSVDYGEEKITFNDAISVKLSFDSSIHPPGYIFSSGGTTGEPKYTHFSYEEFDYMSDMLAQNLRAQGVRPGIMVANLFVAGNLWSSFMAVEKALEKVGAIQLPIGGMCAQDNIINYLQKFRPQIVMGIPSMLVLTAQRAKELNVDLKIDSIFFAGEAMSSSREEFLRECFKATHIGSAGYASVDGGVIGYQCEMCGPGEHHLFSGFIDLKIIEGEGIVSSLPRKSLPIINYRTGDHLEWIEDCKCGRADKRFKLLGRIDSLVHIWGCRLMLSEIESAFMLSTSKILTYQLVLREFKTIETLEICYESADFISEEVLLKNIFNSSRDLKDTISFDQFQKLTQLKRILPGEIKRNPRTGKISLVQDLRR